MHQDGARHQGIHHQATLVGQPQAAGGDVRLHLRIRRDRGAEVGLLEVVHQDVTPPRGVRPGGDSHLGIIGGGKGGVIVASAQQGGERLIEIGRPPRLEVKGPQLARLADRRGVVICGGVREPGVAEVGPTVRHVVVVPGAAERRNLPGAGGLLGHRPRRHVAVTTDPPGPELRAVPGRRAGRYGCLPGRVVAVVLAGVEHRNFDPVGASLIVEILEVGVGDVRAPAVGVFVLELDQEHVAAPVDLVLGSDALHFGKKDIGIGQ